jgi:hypothetical protein
MSSAISLSFVLLVTAFVIQPADGASVRRRVFALKPQMSAIETPGVPALTEAVPDADVVGKGALGVDPAEPYRWVTSPGSDFAFTARGKNSVDLAVLTVWDWENRPVAQTSFAAPFEARVRCEVEGRGTWVLTLDGMRGDECVMRLVRSFSVCPDNRSSRSLWKGSGFWVGQCSFPGRQEAQIDNHPARPDGLTAEQSLDLDAELVARMGAQVARIDLPVVRRDAEGMDLDFGLADKCVRAFASRGLSLDVQLFAPYGAGHGPRLDKYASVTGGAVFPIKEKPYRHYVREVASRYGKHAKFFQIGNEPGNPHQYSGTGEEYVEQVRQAADEIRRVRPRAVVTNGGYCFVNDDTRQIVAGIKGLTDFTAYHWHGDLPGMIEFRAQVEKAHREAGCAGLRFANTEMGLHMPTVGGERGNAVCEMQKLLYCWAHGDQGVLLYSSREIGWPRQHSTEYGFVDHFFCPRFVYGAVSAFLDRYAGFRFERVLKETESLHVYEFRSGNRRMVAAFAVREATETRLNSDAKSAALVDPMGNETVLGDPRCVTLRVGDYPQSVVFDGASRVTAQQELRPPQ